MRRWVSPKVADKKPGLVHLGGLVFGRLLGRWTNLLAGLVLVHLGLAHLLGVEHRLDGSRVAGRPGFSG
jgi:hypothetical protein